jgi:hypothetical protein
VALLQLRGGEPIAPPSDTRSTDSSVAPPPPISLPKAPVVAEPPGPPDAGAAARTAPDAGQGVSSPSPLPVPTRIASFSNDPAFLEARKLITDGKDNDAAYRAASDLIRRFPDDPRGHLYLGLAAFRAGEVERAGQALDAVLDLKQTGKTSSSAPIETVVYGGLLAYALGRNELAATLWEAAAKTFPQVRAQYQPLIDRARANAGLPAKP